jgi:hypothetical protein
MKPILLFFLVACLSGISFAQNITALEYFIDADPGAGAATAVTVTAATSITQSFDVSMASVSEGYHTISVRVKDAGNKWSPTTISPFYKIPASAFAAAVNINKVEYFIDADPGAGAGTNVPVTAGLVVSGLVIDVPITTIADGFHTVTVRALDVNGRWTSAFTSPFYKLSAAALSAAPNLTKLEYFIDNDPGEGAGTALTLVEAKSISNFAFDVNVGALTTGEHKLSVRALDANGRWSFVHIATIGIFGPAPAGQPTSATFTAITATSYTLAYTAHATAPAGYIAIRKLGSAPTKDPVDGTVYIKGNDLGTGNIVAYVGTALTFAETGLVPDTKYHYKIYAYSGATTLTNYLTAAPLEGNTTTCRIRC